MNRYHYLLFFICIALSSCGTWQHFKTSDFAKIESPEELDGTYVNCSVGTDKKNDTLDYWLDSYITIMWLFQISNYSTGNEYKYVDFVTLAYEKPDKVRLTFDTDSISESRVFEGKMKKKYFEIYFKKHQVFIPLIFSSIDIERIRIGKTKDGKLLIRSFNEGVGNLLFLAGGSGGESPYKFESVHWDNNLKPCKVDSKWGYTDTAGNIHIPPRYDYVTMFENSIARVKLDEKWGLIDSTGNEITSIIYDDISPFNSVVKPLVAKVRYEGKEGLINTDGIEVVPAVYDEIENHFREGLVTIRKDGKYGKASRSGIVIPTLYSRLYNYAPHGFFRAERDGKNLYVDTEGYEYDIKSGFWEGESPDLNSKRKIGDFQSEIHER